MSASAELKAQLVEAFRAARYVRIGTVLLVGDSKFMEPRIKRALASGQTVEENGVKQWVEFNIRFDRTKEGSAAYTWKGDKVLHDKILVKKHKDGRIETTPVGTCYREWGNE